jgi:xylan 1,4-beta-xylosidase
MEFHPRSFRQLASITAYYNTRNWHYAYLTLDDGQQVIELMSCDTGQRTQHARCRVDATILSDEHAARRAGNEPNEPEAWGFTGAFVGLWTQDLGADGGLADFDSATYRVVQPD